jgi:hypothetical protein
VPGEGQRPGGSRSRRALLALLGDEQPAPVPLTTPTTAAPSDGVSSQPDPDSDHVPRGLASAATAGAGALVLVELLQLIGTLAQGVTTPSRGPNGAPGGLLFRIGAAFLSSISSVNAVVLLLAVVLAAVPILVGSPTRRRAIDSVLFGTTLSATVVVVGSLLALRERVHQFAVAHQTIPAHQRWALFTYLAGTLAMSVIVVMASLAVRRTSLHSQD